ncbi:MAG: S41 family peptidase [Pseudomonadota bacterium]
MIRLFRNLGIALLGLIGLFAISWLIYMPNGEQRGAWKLSTGGNYLVLTPLTATLYTDSGHSCFAELTFPAHLKLVEMLEGATAEVVAGQLHLDVDGSLDTRIFEKVDVIPANCTAVDPAGATPKDVADAVWTAMNDHYAFFDLHGVDWAERKALIPTADAQLSDDEVNTLLLTMTAGLDDGHVHFGSPERGYDSPSLPPDWIPTDGSLTRQSLTEIAIAGVGVALTDVAGTDVSYGLRDDGIGYILIKSMNVDVPFGGRSQETAAAAFGTMLSALDAAKALVIDIRYNPGGSDSVSFGFAGHFITSAKPVFTKTTKDGDSQTEPFTAVLAPFDNTAETRPTVIMTSRFTGSAAEIFTLAMRTIDTVTVLGEPTSGGLSDVMGFVLPNGWGLGLSNQTYLTMEGEVFEGIGVPPDQPVAYPTEAFQNGEDPVLAAAIETALSLVE